MKTRFPSLLLIATIILSVSCKKKSDEPVYNTASCKINGTVHSFKTTQSLNKLCLLTTYCNTFLNDPNVIEINNISIGFPSDAAAGKIYKNGSAVQLCYYDTQGRGFFNSQYDTLTIRIDQWSGNNGSVTGAFSGLLRYSSSNPPYTIDSVLISNGTFTSHIAYITHE